MARFTDHPLPRGAYPQTAWALLKRRLLAAESVEVLVRYDAHGRPEGIVLRAWDDVRADGSNDARAGPGDEF